jgi:hypothetical protein
MRTWQCRCCGQDLGELPMHYGTPAPALWYAIPEAERDERVLLSSDQCLIGEHGFIVGNLEIPVLDADEAFSWDVWVSLSPANFRRAGELWEAPGREAEPPYFGWLSTSLPGYPETLHLKTHVHTREVGRRPFVELEPTDHPLAVEQRVGITMERVREIAEQVLHGHTEGTA